MFVDRVEIEVQAGNGGNGCVSFRRERYVPRGGPDGGNGGKGGSVILRALAGLDSLAALAHRKHWKAKSGTHGEGSNRHGRGASDLIIDLPPGTLVRDRDQEFVIKDLREAGDTLTAARGGRGGWGNTHFKSATNRAPREATPGEPGESRRLTLELKVIADVGLLGKPNAGKSTLLSRLSRARPQIADYPFTTKVPNLGMVQLDMDRSFVMADIPGLIEGASDGAGLGHEFLRHVERTRVLVHLVEPSPIDGSDPIENYRSIRHEVSAYDAKLALRPEIVVVTKSELPESAEVAERLEKEILSADLGERQRPQLMSISAVTGHHLNVLTAAVWELLQQAKNGSPEAMDKAG